MKTNFACVLLTMAAAASCLAFPKTSFAASDPTGQLAAIYAKTDSALDHKDIDTIESYHSPNYMALNSDGSVKNSDQQREELQQLFNSVGNLDVTTHIEKCDYADKTATVLITRHIVTTIISPNTGKTETVSGDMHVRELWTKGPNGWQVDVVQSLESAPLTPDN